MLYEGPAHSLGAAYFIRCDRPSSFLMSGPAQWLLHQVRHMAGALLAVGRGRLQASDLAMMLEIGSSVLPGTHFLPARSQLPVRASIGDSPAHSGSPSRWLMSALDQLLCLHL